MTRPISLAEAKRRYVHRFTMEHVPAWALQPVQGCKRKFYAPQYRSDREWYDATLFRGESELATRNFCFSTGQTWPLGKFLDAPYRA